MVLLLFACHIAYGSAVAFCKPFNIIVAEIERSAAQRTVLLMVPPLDRHIFYIGDDGFLVASNLCVSEPHETAKQFEAVCQGIGGGKASIKAKHLIQSFAPGEVTPEEAMLIAQELCLRLLKDEYQYVLAVHNDHEHVHAHIIFNNVNMFTGNEQKKEHKWDLEL